MLNFVENLLENERDPRSGPMNDQDHSLSLSDPDRSLVLSHFLTNFLQNLASCHTAFTFPRKILFEPKDTKLCQVSTMHMFPTQFIFNRSSYLSQDCDKERLCKES
jgi:hypothetical protein